MGEKNKRLKQWRFILLSLIFCFAMLVLCGRFFHLHILEQPFLKNQSDARSVRTVQTQAVRGMMTDRRGLPLAVSAPIMSVYVNPKKLMLTDRYWSTVIELLELSPEQVSERLQRYQSRQFMYLKRGVTPSLAKQVMRLGVPGVHVQEAYRRYYPDGGLVGHVLGFTNIDGVGQEGLERAYEQWLKPKKGEKVLLQDRLGQAVDVLSVSKMAQPGGNVQLSIDRRLQYVAYHALKKAVNAHHASGGSSIILDIPSGEVLAMVNQPTFNPNTRDHLYPEYYRNRAVTDAFEPGSVMKPFTIAYALSSGEFTAKSKIDTAPGYYRIGRRVIRDHKNYGTLDLEGILAKSSNIGVAKIMQQLPAEPLKLFLHQLGFGESTFSGFPGERLGTLPSPLQWSESAAMSMAFGYGLSVTALQLVRAYAALADGGKLQGVHILHREKNPSKAEQIIAPEIAHEVLQMLEQVVGQEGTAQRARLRHYRVAGKTGTVRKTQKSGGYTLDQYLALFVGVAPVSHPRLAVVVMIDDPRGDEYYGGQVAAPVFARIMNQSLQILNVAPDKTG